MNGSSDDVLGHELEAARAAVAVAVAGLVGQHHSVVLLHAVAYHLGRMAVEKALAFGDKPGDVINQVGQSVGFGAMAAREAGRLRAAVPVGRA